MSITKDTVKKISNEKYERDLNEEKHLIRYIEPKYMGDVLDEFKEIIRD